jgi:hypothetical protein
MGPVDDGNRKRQLDAQDMGGKWADHVKRMQEFKRLHPYVNVTGPRANGTDEFAASWVDPERENATVTVSYARLGWLMDFLEDRFGRGA